MKVRLVTHPRWFLEESDEIVGANWGQNWQFKRNLDKIALARQTRRKVRCDMW